MSPAHEPDSQRSTVHDVLEHDITFMLAKLVNVKHPVVFSSRCNERTKQHFRTTTIINMQGFKVARRYHRCGASVVTVVHDLGHVGRAWRRRGGARER